MSIDELIDYVESKRISTYKLAKAAGYSRSYVRNVVKGGFPIKQEGLEILVEAALSIGERVTFTRQEMNVIKSYLEHTGYDKRSKPTDMTEREWKEFLSKLT
jgi:transcriptional regulator with XRE-family HTH domain